jgi:hypothetical protein
MAQWLMQKIFFKGLELPKEVKKALAEETAKNLEKHVLERF